MDMEWESHTSESITKRRARGYEKILRASKTIDVDNKGNGSNPLSFIILYVRQKWCHFVHQK